MQAGMGMMAASGPSRMPTSFGQILGQGGMSGLQAYQQALQQEEQRKMRLAQMMEQKRLHDAQIKNYEANAKENEAQAQQRARAAALQEKQSAWMQDPSNQQALQGDPVQALGSYPGAKMDDVVKLLERREEKKQEKQRRLDELTLRLEDRALSREQQAEFKREAMQLRKDIFNSSSSQSRDLAQQRLDMQRELAQQRIDAAERARQDKLEQATGKTDEAKRRVSANLGALDEYYDDLSKLGASVDVKKGGLSNISARIRASGVGQVLGGAIGSEEQSYRNKINQMRPLLLQEIRQASQMGARGLDSNKELEFYLQAATDPARDIQSNKAAIAVLEKAYGLGSRVRVSTDEVRRLQDEFKVKAGSLTPNQPSPIDALLEKYK